ncbi:MAG: sulfurtransferase-like selenium metabolism protein YedF [Breznakibacter sp.]
MKTIDTCGELCPKPLIMAKKAYNELLAGEQMEVLTDNATSLSNLTNFFTAVKAMPVSEKHGNVWHVYVSKPLTETQETVKAEDYCETTTAKGSGRYVVTIKGDQMGMGDPELGKILICSFISALVEQDELPSHVIFYNSGVKLTVKGTDTADSLAKLETKGVTIVICGTCVDFYGLKGQNAVGTVSNMYHIANLLHDAEKVIVP